MSRSNDFAKRISDRIGEILRERAEAAERQKYDAETDTTDYWANLNARLGSAALDAAEERRSQIEAQSEASKEARNDAIRAQIERLQAELDQ